MVEVQKQIKLHEEVRETTQIGDKAIEQFTINYPKPDEIGNFYNNISAKGYDEWALRVNFNEPYYIVDEVERLIEDKNIPQINRNAVVLDCGAGTGLLGYKLKQKGLDLQMTGIDATSSFVEVMAQMEEYKESREVWLGRGVSNFPADLKGRFDVCTASGVFLKGHMPCDALDDCHAALKMGGYFVTAMRSYYYVEGRDEGFKEKLDGLIQAGKFELVNTFTFMRGVEGEKELFAPQESRLLCYKKIAA